MSSKGENGKFFEKMTRKRAHRALIAKENIFSQQHAHDTDAQLLEYVRHCALDIGHSPAQGEVIGGKFIADRFAGWDTAICQAGLELPQKPPKLERRKIFLDELRFQKKSFLEEKLAIKEKRALLEAGVVVDGYTLAEEQSFCEEHRDDTDEELLVYLRQCAAKLGHSPYKREVLGSTLLKERFYNWAVALTLAGLELPRDMRPAKQKDINKVRCRMNNSPK